MAGSTPSRVVVAGAFLVVVLALHLYVARAMAGSIGPAAWALAGAAAVLWAGLAVAARRFEPLASGATAAAIAAFTAAAAVLCAVGALETRGMVDGGTALEVAIVAAYGALSLISHLRRRDDERVTVFIVLAFLISLTVSFPHFGYHAVPQAWRLGLALLDSAVYLGNFAVIVHVTAVLPDRSPILSRARLFLPAHYAAAALLVLGGFALRASAILGSPLPWPITLWNAERTAANLVVVSYLWAGTVGLGLLGHAARRHAGRLGQRQALIMFLGLAAWTGRLAAATAWPAAFATPPLSLLEPVVILLVPICFFVSIFAFRLFDLGFFVRSSMIYGLTGAVLAVAAYLLWLSATRASTALLGVRPSGWQLVVPLAVVGLVFRPLARRVREGVDALFFREKLGLRRLQRTLIAELAGVTELDVATARLAERLRDEAQVAAVGVLVADERREFYRVRAIAGAVARPALARQAVVTGEALRAWRHIASGAPIPRVGRRRAHAGDGELEGMLDLLECAYLIPLLAHGKVIGLVTFGMPLSGIAFDAEDIDNLEALSHQCGAVLENVRLFELATQDPLTRLPRRHFFEERLAVELERARRSGHELAVGVVDVDDFKRVNDTYGHLIGDQVLRSVAATVREACRRSDLVARFGGEEFVLLLPDSSAWEVAALAERLRAAVAERPVSTGDGRELHVTVSIGVRVGSPDEVWGPADLVRAADAALYEAKRAGKNRVVLARPERE